MPPPACPICGDDRQYVNPDGQQWTTLPALQSAHANRFTQLSADLTAIITEPAFAISHRAYLIHTEQGNVLWDCVSYLDAATVAHVRRLGPIQTIDISNTHCYTP